MCVRRFYHCRPRYHQLRTCLVYCDLCTDRERCPEPLLREHVIRDEPCGWCFEENEKRGKEEKGKRKREGGGGAGASSSKKGKGASGSGQSKGKGTSKGGKAVQTK